MRDAATIAGILSITLGLIASFLGSLLWLADILERHPLHLSPGFVAIGGVVAFGVGLLIISVADRSSGSGQ